MIRIRGVMILGAIVGDMCGSLYEFGYSTKGPMKEYDFPLFSEGSVFTDDSVMTLAVADALLKSYAEGNQPVSYALVESMRELGRRYPRAGYGGRFMNWLESPIAHPRPYLSFGNGSGMRVSPVGWAFDTLGEVELVAAESAKVTHNHPEGIRGAQAIAACVLLARQGKGKQQIREYVRERFGYALDFAIDELRPTYTFDVTCQGSVPQAITAYLESTSFEDAIRRAVSLGGDADTIGEMAASIAQAEYGVPEEIEAEARKRLPADLLAVNDRFCERYLG